MPTKYRKFVLGVGAQKAGTTWLYQQLAKHPLAEMSEWKEYGTWDSFLLGQNERRERYSRKLFKLQQIIESNSDRVVMQPKALVLQSRRLQSANGLSRALHLMENPTSYAEHFAHMSSSQISAELFGDFTPSYAQLSSAQFTFIKSLMEGVDFQVKPIFIMRSPHDRIISAFNHQLKILNESGREAGEALVFEEFCANRRVRLQTEYQNTVRSLDESFGRDNVFYAAFESLFTPETMLRLESFLGVTGLEGNFAAKSNEGSSDFKPSEEQVAILKQEYRLTYEFCQTRFPEFDLGSMWDM